ncbi:hypothetical protein [Rhizobium halophytocola]|uniref:Uncharacterized protein n=1 Tax=Rhizobium halophytocola TaxID=735519 RepID=A0ABS4DWU4_9HYPH|nr:hypothetical protein [Rhizobium halophytocola]MBP1850163.1 hypothetical protein [Rhizobium halophytocola]
MRIDSGLNGYYYQSRVSYSKDDADDASGEAATTARARTQDPSVSSSFLSASLSGALWALEGSSETDATGSSTMRMTTDQPRFNEAEQVEAFYLEYGDPQA